MSERIVVDTNVVVSAMKSSGGTSREVLRLCLQRGCHPLMGDKLFAECEDVLSRPALFRHSPLSSGEREELIDAYFSVCEWVPVFFLWRPNLPDEGDNHLIELAVAGAATKLITFNVRDLRSGELRFPQLEILTPSTFMRNWRADHGDDDDPNL